MAKVIEKANIVVPECIEIMESGSSSGGSISSANISVNYSSTDVQETTYDALEYIAGYLAKQFKDKIPHLGDITARIKSDHTYNLPSWVQQLSYGGLIKPSNEWLQKIIKWNHYFEIFHGNAFRKGPLITQRLTNKIKKRDTMPVELIKSFL